ncbi:MAG: hypothetical protein AB1421_10035 [Pseudomonadota bacterium]
MSQDWWVHEWMEALNKARNSAEIEDLIEQLEDRYDAFSGPGQDLVDDLLAQARRRLESVR